jgi:membrane protein
MLYALRSFWILARETVSSWIAHKDARAGAALAYYSVFSLGPVMVIAIAIAGVAFGSEAAAGQVESQLRDVLGDAAAQAVNAMLVSAKAPKQGLFATIIGTTVLLFTAIGVVAELKDAFNTVWEVHTKKVSGLWDFIRTYLVSLAAVLSLGFLLLISLLFTAALSAIGKYFDGQLPTSLFHLVGSVVSFAVVASVFAMMFKLLPDTKVEWRDVALGAGLTAVLFELGKLAIGIYVGNQALDSAYGAAASLVVILIWIYYTSQIVLIGAEFTHRHAVWHRQRTGLPPGPSQCLTGSGIADLSIDRDR